MFNITGFKQQDISTSPAYNAYVTAWIAKLNTLTSPTVTLPSTATLAALSTMCDSIGNTILGKLDAMYISAVNGGETRIGTVNLINPNDTFADLNNSPTWTENQGHTGNGTDGLYLWGFQMETRRATAVGLYPTSYIPTSGTAVTRAVDSLQLTNAATAGFVGASGGTMMIYFKNNIPYTRDGSIYFGISDNSGLNPGTGIRVVNPTGTTRLQINKSVSGTNAILFNSTTNDFKMVVTWGGSLGSNLDLFVNGQKIALNPVTERPFSVVNPLNFVGTPLSGTLLPFYIQDMALFNTTLSDAQCIELSSL